jgi:hypothetical protein
MNDGQDNSTAMSNKSARRAVSRRSLWQMGVASVIASPAIAQPTMPQHTPILTRSYNNTRSGWNPKETILTQANVAAQGIKRLFSLNMEGDNRGSEAQTLIVPNVSMVDGLRHDIAIQASMSDGLFAFDANTSELLWMVKLGRPIKGSRAFDMYGINDNWGILGTPVIDPATKTLYCVSWTSVDRVNTNARYYAHAINITNGAKVAPSVDLSNASYDPGHGLPVMTLGTIFRKQRAGLLLMTTAGQKALVIAFAAGAESSETNHGWVVAMSINPFRITAGWNNSPRLQGGGIWQASQAPAADENGNIYFVCGNGAFDGVTDFGECFTKLHYTPPASATAMGKLTCVDWWTPFTDTARAGEAGAPTLRNRPSSAMIREPSGDLPVNETPDQPRAAAPPDLASRRAQQLMMQDAADNLMLPAASNAAWTDQDLGSAGALLIPKFNLLLGAGKDGILYVLNSNNLGKTSLSAFSSAAGIQANYAKAKQILWFTFFPGFDVSPTPTDLTKLNIDFANRTHHQHSTPTYFESAVNGPMLFCCGENGPVRAWSVNANGVAYLANSDEVASPNAPVPPGGMPGGMMSIASNGSARGTALLITCFPYGNANKEITKGFFVVYDPENFDTRPDGSKRLRALWRSSDWNIDFDFCKFNVPVVSGGKIYVPTYSSRVDVYGLA